MISKLFSNVGCDILESPIRILCEFRTLAYSKRIRGLRNHTEAAKGESRDSCLSGCVFAKDNSNDELVQLAALVDSTIYRRGQACAAHSKENVPSVESTCRVIRAARVGSPDLTESATTVRGLWLGMAEVHDPVLISCFKMM